MWFDRVFFSGVLAAGLLAPHSAGTQADSPTGLSKMISDGSAKFSLRYRYEFVDQDGFDEEAGASTAKARFNWTSGTVNGFSAGLETDYVFTVGDDQYNSTVNGRTEYPVVADPDGFDVNQAFVKYASGAGTVTVGRQRVLHGGQRFVGGVGWRQNEQTYDAARAIIEPFEGLSIDYSYVWNVNRIFGPDRGVQPTDWDSDSHFALVSYAINEKHKLSGFTYLLDFSNDNGLPNSTATYGIEYSGKIGGLTLAATYASQSDYADSPLDYEADYYATALSYKFPSVSLTVGYEVLGSDDGVAAFRTPLATLHKFQGWADKFLGAPANGIEDAYLGIAGSLSKVKLAATYHDFSANEGSADYGSEIDVVATMGFSKHLNVQLKLASYDADELASDTTKIWATVNVSF